MAIEPSGSYDRYLRGYHLPPRNGGGLRVTLFKTVMDAEGGRQDETE